MLPIVCASSTNVVKSLKGQVLGIALCTGYALHGETVVSHVGSVARIRAMPSVPLNPAGCSQRFSERKIQIYSDFEGLKMHSVH